MDTSLTTNDLDLEASSSAARHAAGTGFDARPAFDRHRTAFALGIGAVVAMLAATFAWQLSAYTAAAGTFGSAWLTEPPITPIGADVILADMQAAKMEGVFGAALGATSEAQAVSPGALAAGRDPLAAQGLEAQAPARFGGQAAPSPAASTVSGHGQAEAGALLRSAPAKARALAGRTQRAKSGPGGTSVVTANAEADYAALFGAPEQYRAGNALHTRAAQKGEVVVPQAGGEGTLLPARLQTEVASVPAGGPVIALLQRPVRLMGSLWPRGTEVHGVCNGSGNSDTRIFITFEALRLPNGRMQGIRGLAVDLQGRHGVPGRKQLSGRTAGSVGLAAATSAAQVFGRAMAGSVGAVLGSGIEGAAIAGQNKAQRLDQDEYVVTVARGVPLQIYIVGTTERSQ